MIRLRAAEPADEWPLWALRREIEPNLTRDTHLAWWWAARGEHRFLAYDGPAFVGVIRITPPQAVTAAPRIGLVHLQVAKKEQGKGFGVAMLEQIQAKARALGFTALEAIVAADNTPSQSAFRTARWRPTRFQVDLDTVQ